MLTFNLLPPERKAELRFYRIATTLSRRIILLAGLSTIFSLLMGLAVVSLRVQKTALEAARESRTGDAAISAAQKAQKEISAFNKEIKDMTDAFPERKWSLLLQEIGKLAPATVRIKDLGHETTKDQETLIISGHADKREDLISFEEGLKKSSSFTQVTSPLANFRKPEDVDFTINAELMPPYANTMVK